MTGAIGRPSTYTQEIADEICERIAKGESVRSICSDQESGWLPNERTVYRWLEDNEDFRQQYAHARGRQADHYFEEIIAIADAPNAVTNAAGEVELRDAARDRLRVDARKWVASKLAPKKYGDKVAVVGGGEDDPPIQHVSRIELIAVRPRDDSEA